ncbi:MAG: uracil-DNA glycosylase [Porticoccaceae bacterium]|nr:uracil-DNA glycosylase [Porticoccaceae bacterium]
MSSQREIKLHSQWRQVIGDEFDKEYMQTLREFLIQRKHQGAVIYPPADEWFSALNHTLFQDVRVVILGQDPYHGVGQAHGLCFSVRPGIKVPPSLANIFKEIKSDLSIDQPNHGCLVSWAQQGVLLLNATLTVEDANAGAHQGKGWEQFTDQIIKAVNEHRKGVVFMLWGSHAQKKSAMIDASRHLILKSVHPSPLSAYRGFLGCGHFSMANRYLEEQGLKQIDWQLPEQEDALKAIQDSSNSLS